MRITAVILTRNEEIHLARCIESIIEIAEEIIVVDCFSVDKTVEIANSYGARVIQHEWKNHASQFNWALTQLHDSTEWVLRIDADEYLDSALIFEIQNLSRIALDVDGLIFRRRIKFQGKLIRYGGLFPVKVLRLFRFGSGHCENRLMDEHIVVSGKTIELTGELIDDNLNSLTWWTDKHNRYASLEAIELLNLEYHFLASEVSSPLQGNTEAKIKRFLKEVLYFRLPGGLRAFTYFLYRYVIRFGFLDGTAGTSFHFLQGFWYRYLVDTKIAEVKRCMDVKKVNIVDAIDGVLGIQVGRN